MRQYSLSSVPETDAYLLFEALGKKETEKITYPEFVSYIKKREDELRLIFNQIDLDGVCTH